MLCLEPIDTALPHNKMTPAAFLPPDRGVDGNVSPTVKVHTPSGAYLLQQVELNGIAASAWAKQSGAPELTIFSG
jgi:hypothetical protein